MPMPKPHPPPGDESPRAPQGAAEPPKRAPDAHHYVARVCPTPRLLPAARALFANNKATSPISYVCVRGRVLSHHATRAARDTPFFPHSTRMESPRQ